MSNFIGVLIGALLPAFIILYVFFTGLKLIIRIARFLNASPSNPSESKPFLGRKYSEQMPRELTEGKLFLSESDIATTLPRPIHGRVDQVYEYKGALVPVDTKVRQSDRIYPSDVAQLSVYKVILENGLKHRVLPYGYIRLIHYGVHGRSVRYKKVKLFSEHRIVSLWECYKTHSMS